MANQTELIYTVLVNGRPVLATTAAKDMELVSEAEAAKTLGKAVYMKSERKFMNENKSQANIFCYLKPFSVRSLHQRTHGHSLGTCAAQRSRGLLQLGEEQCGSGGHQLAGHSAAHAAAGGHTVAGTYARPPAGAKCDQQVVAVPQIT